MQEQLNLKGPAVAMILETMARYELKEMHQLRESEEALRELKLKLKPVQYIKLSILLREFEQTKAEQSVRRLTKFVCPRQETLEDRSNTSESDNNDVHVDVDSLLEMMIICCFLLLFIVMSS